MPRKSSVSGIFVNNESQMLSDLKPVTCSNQWPFVPTALILLYQWVPKNPKDKASSLLGLARLCMYICSGYLTEKPADFIGLQFASINEGSLLIYIYIYAYELLELRGPEPYFTCHICSSNQQVNRWKF